MGMEPSHGEAVNAVDAVLYLILGGSATGLGILGLHWSIGWAERMNTRHPTGRRKDER